MDFSSSRALRLRALSIEPVELKGERYLALHDRDGYAPDCALPASHAPILMLFDGTRTTEEIWEIVRQSGAPREWFDSFIAELDESFLLDSPRFRAERAEREKEFLSALSRPAALAGTSYPAEPETLRAFLEEKLEIGAVRLPPRIYEPEQVRGIVTPHIDFHRGGHVEAASYTPLIENVRATGQEFDTLVILGIAHCGVQFPFCAADKDFETPFGPMPCDREFVNDLITYIGPELMEEQCAHRDEHSIEFSAVFCRFFPELQNAQIVPILCGGFWNSLQTGRSPEEADEGVSEFVVALRETTRQHELNGKKIGFIASVDGAHVGTQFGDSTPLTRAKLEQIRREDELWCNAIARGDKANLHAHFAKNGNQFHVDAHPALYTLLAAFPEWRGQFLDYDQAFHPDQNIVVSFASLALFEALS